MEDNEHLRLEKLVKPLSRQLASVLSALSTEGMTKKNILFFMPYQ